MVKKFNPYILFLIETKRKSTKIEVLRARMSFDNCFAVNNIGKDGGLALLRMNTSSLEVLSFSNQHIDAKVRDILGDQAWRFTGFYGNPNAN